MKTVLITGATGYVGQHLVNAYLAQGYNVVACARTQDHLDALANKHASAPLTTQALDMTDKTATREVVEKYAPDIIVHAAAYPRRKAAEQAGANIAFEETPLYKLNVEGTRNLAEAAAGTTKPMHLSVISSGAAFEQGFARVDVNSPRNMGDVFAKSKNLGEQALEQAVAGHDSVTTSILYPPVILDETQVKGIIPFAAAKALRGEDLENNAPEKAGMNMILADDFTKAVLGVTTKQQEAFARYTVNGYRLGTKELLQKVAYAVAKTTGKEVTVRDGATTMAGMPEADETALRKLLGASFSWQPIDGMLETIVGNQVKGQEPRKLDLMQAIRTAYPDATQAELKAALTPEFLSAAYGKLPHYSTLSAPMLHTVKTATVASFVVCHSVDPTIRNEATKSLGEPVMLITKRGDKGPNGEDRFGILGGYADIGNEKTAGEQPAQGLVREMCEEALNDKGTPLLKPNPSRLKMLLSGVDYRNFKLPVQYTGHTLELNPLELATLKEHSRRMQEDTAYKQAVLEQSHGEIADIRVVPVSEVLQMKKESFTHPHEFDALTQVAKQLQQSQSRQR